MHHDACPLEVHYVWKPRADSTATSRTARFGIYRIFDLGPPMHGRTTSNATKSKQFINEAMVSGTKSKGTKSKEFIDEDMMIAT